MMGDAVWCRFRKNTRWPITSFIFFRPHSLMLTRAAFWQCLHSTKTVPL